MKKELKVLAAVFAASVMFGFAGCKNEMEEDSSEKSVDFNVPDAGISKAGSTVTATVTGKNFNVFTLKTNKTAL